MKTIIAGSRDCNDYTILLMAILQAQQAGFEITEVVSGHARGVDRMGEEWADTHDVPTKLFPVPQHEWNQYGRAADHLRNKKMADYAEALIAIWDGKSPGTKNMITEATARGLKVYVYRTDEYMTLWSE